MFGFRTSNLKQRWLNTRFSLGYATNATAAFGGVVAASLGERMALLRLSDGTKLCEKTFDERSFSSILPPVFDPSSGGIYLFDTAAKDVYKASSTCQQAWVYLADDDVAGFAASSSTVVGAGGHDGLRAEPLRSGQTTGQTRKPALTCPAGAPRGSRARPRARTPR